MMKVNTETGYVLRHNFGNKIAGGAVLISRGTKGEDDGYLAISASDQENRTVILALLDAVHIDADPVAVIRLPQRVPQSLHGNWISKTLWRDLTVAKPEAYYRWRLKGIPRYRQASAYTPITPTRLFYTMVTR